MSEANPKHEKWTEIEHLPEWDEEYYLVYTARKHGKWVMMKALRPELADNPEYRSMQEREFDVRYNLSHPNIVMINDFEDVPGVGRAIICDDVYGKSLRSLINDGKVTRHHIEQLRTRLPLALQYIEENHIVHAPLRPETIIFTDKIENLKLIDVGFQQRSTIKPHHAAEDMAAYGRVMLEALDACKEHQPGYLHKIAQRCASATEQHMPYRNISTLRLALDRRRDWLYLIIIAFLCAMVAVLAYVVLRTPAS